MSRIYPAETRSVKNARELVLLLDLDFSVRTEQSVILAGFPNTRFTKDEWGRARHCLIVLVGGKKLYVEPAGSTDNRPWTAHVYVPGELPGFVGVQQDSVVNKLCFRLNEYVQWLARQDVPFNPDDVCKHLNFNPRLETTDGYRSHTA